VTYLALALVMLQYSTLHYLYSLLLSITAAYGLSAWYLHRQVMGQINPVNTSHTPEASLSQFAARFMRYGLPLSGWFILAYLLTLTDKLFMRQWVSGEAQGNYQAMFDLISRTITLLISPVILAMYPLLTSAYEKGERMEIRKLLGTILLLEGAAMLLTMAGYWLFGAGWLFALIHTPDGYEYKTAGLLVIAGTFIWQMAVVVQKKYELRLQSARLLLLLAAAFLLQLVVYCLAGRSGNLLVFPAGYLLASLTYLLLLLIPGRRLPATGVQSD
jgi:O-antigen/teichoic acid export membrane protein